MASSKFLTLDDVDLKDKKVLVRVDLNLPIQNGKVTDLTRLERIIPTLKELLNKKAIVIILSHLGRPLKEIQKGASADEYSLKVLTPFLSNYLGQPVSFFENCVGQDCKKAIADLKPGEVILLENVRFHEGEEKNDPAFSKQLAELADYYINDAFSCSHRAHASVVGVTEHLMAIAGRGVEQELKALEKIMESPERPFMAITGGSKISTKLSLLENLITKVDYLVLGGAMANTFLVAKNYSIGQSMCEPDMIDLAKSIMEKAAKHNCHLILPEDVIVARDLTDTASIRSTLINQINPDEKIFDIGEKTLSTIAQALHNSKTVIWNGPVGVFEVPPFDQGSCRLAELLGRLTLEEEIISVAGGGDTLACLKKSASQEALTYTSTAGGAFLEWLEGKTLPGIECLLKAKLKRS